MDSGSSVDHASGGVGGVLASLYYGERVLGQLLPSNTSMVCILITDLVLVLLLKLAISEYPLALSPAAFLEFPPSTKGRGWKRFGGGGR